MKIDVHGKTVAIVGRAGSLLRLKRGAEIDQADVVIRINWVHPIPDEQKPWVGSKTDLVYHCKRAKQARITSSKLGIKTQRCSGKARRHIAETLFQNPKKFRPTTGFVAIVDALNSGAREIRLYGFDFFQSGHVQDREPDGDDYSKPLAWLHSPEEERRALKRLLKRHPQLVPDQVLTEAVR